MTSMSNIQTWDIFSNKHTHFLNKRMYMLVGGNRVAIGIQLAQKCVLHETTCSLSTSIKSSLLLYSFVYRASRLAAVAVRVRPAEAETAQFHWGSQLSWWVASLGYKGT